MIGIEPVCSMPVNKQLTFRARSHLQDFGTMHHFRILQKSIHTPSELYDRVVVTMVDLAQYQA
jgi:hypothetical protein